MEEKEPTDEDSGGKKVDPKLDVVSEQFDPLSALYASQVPLPCPSAPVFDNLSRFEMTPEGLVIKEVAKPKDPAVKASSSKQTVKPKETSEDKEESIQKRKGRLQKNVLMNMERVEGPLATLRGYIENEIQIKVVTRDMSNVRGSCTGTLVAFDKMWNLAMVNVYEVWTRKIKRKCSIVGK